MPNNEQTIGYSHPPVNKQWKKGQSGNPNGRPRGSKNTLDILNRLANEEIKVTQNGKKIKMSKKAAALLQAVNKAAQGDSKALKTLLPHLMAADAKAAGHLDFINFKSPRFDKALCWVIEIFEESMNDSNIDKITQQQVFGHIGRRMADFEQIADSILNDKNWTKENSPENPFIGYREVKPATS